MQASENKTLKRLLGNNGNVGRVFVRTMTAAVLFVAGLLKAYQLATVPVLGSGLLETRWFQIFLVECELALAILLISQIAPKLIWILTTILFVIFGIVSLTRGIGGAESCGCFGAVNINPFLTFTLDVGIVVLLVVFRPRKLVARTDVEKSNWFVQTVSMTVVLIIVSVAQVYIFFGSFVGLNDFTNSGEIAFEIDETFNPKTGDTVKILVTNNLSKPITLVAASPDCGCGRVEELPVFIQPRSKASVFFVAFEHADRVVNAKRRQKILFFIDAGGTRKQLVELPLFDFLARG
jgi:hypothetical protein